jgi:hypothetical protein
MKLPQCWDEISIGARLPRRCYSSSKQVADRQRCATSGLSIPSCVANPVLLEEIMKYVLGAFALLLFTSLISLSATTAQDRSTYQQGMILSVARRGSRNHKYSNGTNPADASLQPKVYAYDVTVRIACETYVGHYESSSDSLPASIADNTPVQARAGKHFLYLKLPSNQQMKMAIVSRKTDSDGTCASKQTQP